MSRKNKNSKSNNNICNQNNNLSIDYDKLAKAIVKAQDEANQIKQKEKDKAHKEWQKKIGIKNPPTKMNTFLCGLKLFLFPKKYYSYNMNGTEMLMSMFLSAIFSMIEYVLYMFGIIFLLVFGYVIYSNQITISNAALLILSFVFCVFFGRIFRIARIEVDNIKDDNKIISIFSAVVTFIAMVGTIISIFPMIKNFFTIGILN
jgi:hypothetical protein